MSMLTPNQKQQVGQIQSLNKQEQAEKLANFCNANGITKEQLANIISKLNRS
jgi:hypothetical protein